MLQFSTEARGLEIFSILVWFSKMDDNDGEGRQAIETAGDDWAMTMDWGKISSSFYYRLCWVIKVSCMMSNVFFLVGRRKNEGNVVSARGNFLSTRKLEIHDSFILLHSVSVDCRESATRRIYEFNLCQFSLNNVIGTTKLTLNAREIDSKWEAIWLFSIDSRKSESTSHDKLELNSI